MTDLKKIDLGTLTANGSTPSHQVTGSEVSPTASVNLRSIGSFGGGVLRYEASQDRVDWYELGINGIISAPGGVEAKILEGEYVRSTLSGATNPNVSTFILLPGTSE